jgi:hypothetical protein
MTLDVWFERRVLSVERFAWKPQIIRYKPGDWERHLINAAKVAAKSGCASCGQTTRRQRRTGI